MKRFLLPVLLAAACWAAPQSVKMSLNMAGLEAGTATVSIKPTSDGGFSGHMEMNIDLGGQKGHAKFSFAYSKDGRPKTHTQTLKLGPESKVEKQTYTATHVNVTTTENGKTTTKKVAIPKGADLRDPSAFWFWKTKPKVGASVTAWHYDSEEGRFVKETSKYVGKKTITVGGRKVQTHYITMSEGEEWLDDKGMPVRIIFNEGGMEMVLERIWK